MTFTEKDIQHIENKGLTLNQVNEQINLFKSGIPFTKIVEAATIGNGILKLDDKRIEGAISYFENQKNNRSLLKFVPASGAATRMFKFLFQFLEDYNPKQESLNSFIDKHELKNITVFLDGLEKFPFYKQVLQQLAANGINYQDLSSGDKAWHFITAMLDRDQLNFGDQPKGLLPFHACSDQDIYTAFEEHLFETALYGSDKNKAKLHFTISEQYENLFHKEFKRIKAEVENKTGVQFDISYSYQQGSTDTIAVTPNDEPFRNDDGTLLFRPSGHGALIKNLNALDADIIFVKNIDNVVISKYREDVSKYKKVLAGILLELQTQTFEHLETLENSKIIESKLSEIADFLTQDLNVKLPLQFETYSDNSKMAYLREKLNRPIRVCGMVKNEGEPGGGPFWIIDENNNQSLQIVESAQIDLEDASQANILKNSTHFNPVDLVCGVKNYKGKKFDLENYVNHKSAFITSKTKLGKPLKALELPGLWNGSMAHWNTIFVEVPIITFNPVKTVNDLLKPAHQTH
jgi:hypothetical protein